MSLGQNDNAILKLLADEELRKQNAALAAEVERLKQPWVKILTESETWKALSEVARLTAENDHLRAEVEWLRKADRLVCWNEAAQEWQVRHEHLK